MLFLPVQQASALLICIFALIEFENVFTANGALISLIKPEHWHQWLVTQAVKLSNSTPTVPLILNCLATLVELILLIRFLISVQGLTQGPSSIKQTSACNWIKFQLEALS